ncbi:threonine aldolase family protein [Pararhodobacter zhoushanensis]|uniref:threonine aldolase family protein n=1 Tax=Pararhodobacter zhoushanensis TaxID=2479545 RepID=UPI000F8E7AE9|nr:beta-eliminating lyase-related protein [Pararhodobacter zhoushanensis]
MFLASDNTSGVPEQVLAALGRVNDGFSLGYGADDLMQQVQAKIRTLFEAPDAAVFLVATGTSANSLAIATYVQPWSAVYCHRHAHIEEDECNAPEFYSNAKLSLVDGEHAKIDAQALETTLTNAAEGVHHVQPGLLSLTNLTERGARYTVAEVTRLAAIAKAKGLPVHMDGARFANALVAEGCTPAEMTWKAGVDVLSFGGTKNGLLGVEAVIFFDPAKAWEFELRRKRGGHLFSKHRFLSAQMDAYLTDDLWLDLARTANARAEALEAGLTKAGVRLLHPRGGNMLFAEFPLKAHDALRAAGAVYYDWPAPPPQGAGGDHPHQCRLVASWSTTEADIARFIEVLTAAL